VRFVIGPIFVESVWSNAICYPEICGLSIATQQWLVWSQIWQRDANDRLKRYNLHIDHVRIRSDLSHPNGAKNVNSKCRVLCGKTGSFPMVEVFRVVRPIPTVRFHWKLEPEPNQEFRTVANTTCCGNRFVVWRELSAHSLVWNHSDLQTVWVALPNHSTSPAMNYSRQVASKSCPAQSEDRIDWNWNNPEFCWGIFAAVSVFNGRNQCYWHWTYR